MDNNMMSAVFTSHSAEALELQCRVLRTTDSPRCKNIHQTALLSPTYFFKITPWTTTI